jgi:hypothetical protein
MKWSQLTVFKYNIGYLPVHYIARMTPLRFIDIPFRITDFGDVVVKANSAYIHTITDTLIWLYENIIEMLEARILCFTDLARSHSGLASNSSVQNTSIPSWYSDNISVYWDIAGIPRTISGSFNYQERGNRTVQVPAVLSFVPSEIEQNISGWFFSIGSGNNFLFFIDPNNAAKVIYSRRGRTPQERSLELRGTLHINDSANSPIERDIIEQCLKPKLNTHSVGVMDTIDIIIRYDGNTFEIRQYPARSNSLIFRGVL